MKEKDSIAENGGNFDVLENVVIGYLGHRCCRFLLGDPSRPPKAKAGLVDETREVFHEIDFYEGDQFEIEWVFAREYDFSTTYV